jgi:hypothetical protein
MAAINYSETDISANANEQSVTCLHVLRLAISEAPIIEIVANGVIMAMFIVHDE